MQVRYQNYIVNALRLVSATCLIALLTFIAMNQVTPVSMAQETKQQQVKVEYDATKDQTLISLNPFVLASRKFEELRLGGITGYPGKVKTKPKEVILIFLSLSSSDSNKYETARKLTVTADGQKFLVGEASHGKQSQNNLFIETMTASMQMEDFLRVCKAKQVTMKLGLTEVELTPEHIATLRLAASYMVE